MCFKTLVQGEDLRVLKADRSKVKQSLAEAVMAAMRPLDDDVDDVGMKHCTL